MGKQTDRNWLTQIHLETTSSVAAGFKTMVVGRQVRLGLGHGAL